MLSPIVLFTYNRPWHTQQTVDALLKNFEAGDSDLIVFSDGEKDEEGKQKVAKVRRYLRTIKGFKSVRIVEREENFGLAKSIISGVTEVTNEYGRIIVLEDDMVTSPYFLRYMNDGLIRYDNDDRVISINGYNYPIKESLPDVFFIKGADCLGWGTWKQGWELFEEDGRKLLRELTDKDLLNRFDLFGSYDFSGMLRSQINGTNQSWAVRWYASALLNDKLSLYPAKTLIQHIGSDGSGTHCGDHSNGMHAASVSMLPLKYPDIVVAENQTVLMLTVNYLKGTNPGLMMRVVNRLLRLIKS